MKEPIQSFLNNIAHKDFDIEDILANFNTSSIFTLTMQDIKEVETIEKTFNFEQKESKQKMSSYEVEHPEFLAEWVDDTTIRVYFHQQFKK